MSFTVYSDLFSTLEQTDFLDEMAEIIVELSVLSKGNVEHG